MPFPPGIYRGAFCGGMLKGMRELLEQVQDIVADAPLPDKLLRVHQTFEGPKVTDLVGSTKVAVDRLVVNLDRGGTVAVGVGSRGIANLDVITRATVDRLKELGFEPFIFPAMGSHGGATADGQLGVLESFGVTPEAMGVAFKATMEVAEIGRLEDGTPLCQDVNARAADATLLISRIKPHTDFRSHLESGPSKMCVIGLGKRQGASMMHNGGVPAFQRYLAPAARNYEAHTNFVGAVCLVENAYDETAIITALTAAEVGLEPEAALLQTSKELMASIPFPVVDVLVIQQIGKDISGAGMDPNVTGRLMIPREPENFGGPDLATIAVLNLTEATHGNAAGLGFADVTTARVLSQVDWHVTYTNAITSGSFGMRRSQLPITVPDDRRALCVALRGCTVPDQSLAKMVFIRDTLTLDTLWVSPTLRAEVQAHPRLEVLEEVSLSFDADGMMTNPWRLPRI